MDHSPVSTRSNDHHAAISDADLIGRARQGQHAAVEELLARHEPSLRQAVAAGLSPRARAIVDADDIIQETWLDACLGLDAFFPAHAGAFGSWLRTIARRKICDAIRGHRRLKRGGDGRDGRYVGPVTLDSVAHLLADVTRTTPSRGLARRDLEAMVHRLAELLPADHRTLVLRDLAGVETEQIAAELGRSVGAVYTLRKRVHDELRAMFQSRMTDFRSFL